MWHEFKKRLKKSSTPYLWESRVVLGSTSISAHVENLAPIELLLCYPWPHHPTIQWLVMYRWIVHCIGGVWLAVTDKLYQDQVSWSRDRSIYARTWTKIHQQYNITRYDIRMWACMARHRWKQLELWLLWWSRFSRDAEVVKKRSVK